MQDTKNYLITAICKMRKELGYKDILQGADYKINNLKRIYTQLTDEIDLYPEI